MTNLRHLALRGCYTYNNKNKKKIKKFDLSVGSDQGLGEEGGEVRHYLPEVYVDVGYHNFITEYGNRELYLN